MEVRVSSLELFLAAARAHHEKSEYGSRLETEQIDVSVATIA